MTKYEFDEGSTDIDEAYEEVEEATGIPADPLAELEPAFRDMDADPFDMYLAEEKVSDDITEEVFQQWVNCFGEWKDFMEAQNRHPALPSPQHVNRYVDWHLDEREHTEGHVKAQLYKLNACYEWMQSNAVFAIPDNHNPFSRWLKKGKLVAVTKKNYPPIEDAELQERLEQVTNIRERAYFVCLLKWGCRASELCNIKLSEITIDHPDLKDHYEAMGTHDKIRDYENVVFIPKNRKGNKRKLNTILPLDEETRQILVDWLLIRPDTGEEQLFLTDKGNELDKGSLRYAWKKYWGDMYFDDDEEYDNVSPHWARHYYTTWWANTDIPTDRRKYLRGDITDEQNESNGAMDLYTHIGYDDIKDDYLEKVFQFRLNKV